MDCTDASSPDRTVGPVPYDLGYTLADAGQLLAVTSRTGAGAGTASTVSYRYPVPAKAGAAVPRPHAVTGVDGQVLRYNAVGELTGRTAGPDSPALALSWTPEHTVATATGTGVRDSYVYDPAGIRILRRGTDSSMLTLDGVELVLTGGQVTARRAYTYGGVTVAWRTAAGLSLLLGDRQGSTSVSINASTGAVQRNQYLPYGATRTTQITTTDRGFLAKPHDTGTGLDALDHRSYDPTLARFTSPDPLYQPFNPAALDTYGYASNNPTTGTDPSGLCAIVEDSHRCEERGSGSYGVQARTATAISPVSTPKSSNSDGPEEDLSPEWKYAISQCPTDIVLCIENGTAQMSITAYRLERLNDKIKSSTVGSSVLGVGSLIGADDFAKALHGDGFAALRLAAMYALPGLAEFAPELKFLKSMTWLTKTTEAEIPTVVFSRSAAPGLAGNFDQAVADGAPTTLNRATGAARDANRRAALRGQAPAPAGMSLDEYPFACSAQGGAGACVGAVPVGEQSYQGGVLSSFFQKFGVDAGDAFNVVFGP